MFNQMLNFDTLNRNGRIYTQQSLEKAWKDYLENGRGPKIYQKKNRVKYPRYKPEIKPQKINFDLIVNNVYEINLTTKFYFENFPKFEDRNQEFIQKSKRINLIYRGDWKNIYDNFHPDNVPEGFYSLPTDFRFRSEREFYAVLKDLPKELRHNKFLFDEYDIKKIVKKKESVLYAKES